MKASYGWIRELLPAWNGSPEALRDCLTFSGSEVEAVSSVADDVVLDVAITSNRPDCLCHIGLAREVAVVHGLPLALPMQGSEMKPLGSAGPIQVEVEDPVACPRFVGLVLEDVRVVPSPPALRARVEALGLRSINAVVDITNLVMLECNQPLHAYDMDRIGGGVVRARRARAGESFRALNGTEYRLTADDLVIADGQVPLGLAGVMGGLHSEVRDETARIFLESASFDALSIRRSAKRHQLATDASRRFERGVDRAGAAAAARRAAGWIQETCGGTVLPWQADVGGPGPARPPIKFRPSRVLAVCGVLVPLDRMQSIFEALGCGVTREESGLWKVSPPSFRFDLSREIDLVEEVIRIHGLHHVSVGTAMPVRVPHEHPGRQAREAAQDRLAALGYLECVTPDFVPEGALAGVAFFETGTGLLVRNPVRTGEGALRRSLLPSLLLVRKLNQDRGNDNINIFEVSPVRSAQSREMVTHRTVLGVLTDGDFRSLRGTVEAVLERLGASPVSVEPQTHPALEVGRTGVVQWNGKVVGYLGQPNGALLKHVGLKCVPQFAELDLAAVTGLTAEGRFVGLPRFPGVVRDLSFELDEGRAYGDVAALIENARPRWFESLELFDVFRGKQVPPGKKSLAIRLAFRSSEGTLTADDVADEVHRLIGLLEGQLGARVRRS